jgi:hypothetical protein
VVILRHDHGFSSIYGHLNVIIAREGEAVRQGQSIGGVGSTGRSTGLTFISSCATKPPAGSPSPHAPTIEELLEKARKIII